MTDRESPESRPAAGGCEMESRVLAARRPGAAVAPAEAERIAAHLDGCAPCRRAARVSTALARLAADGPGFQLPDPHRLYWRARVLERLAPDGEATERATRPLRWLGWLTAALVSLVAALVLTRLGDDLTAALLAGATDSLGALRDGLAAPLVALTGLDPALAQLALWLALALLAGATLLAAHALLEDPT